MTSETRRKSFSEMSYESKCDRCQSHSRGEYIILRKRQGYHVIRFHTAIDAHEHCVTVSRLGYIGRDANRMRQSSKERSDRLATGQCIWPAGQVDDLS